MCLVNTDAFFSKIKEAYPLEYINKNAYFYKSNFYVDDRVLIPRSETEILVEDASLFLKKSKLDKLKIAEVGVGSFALGLSLLEDVDKEIEFLGGDICEDALKVSKINLVRHKQKLNPKHHIELVLSDRFEKLDGKFDLIVSNPPYIKENEDALGVHHQAHSFEPHVALYLEDHIFEKWFVDFFKDAYDRLSDGGALMIEGHEDSLLHLKEIALKYFKKVNVKNDYTQRVRFLHCFK